MGERQLPHTALGMFIQHPRGYTCTLQTVKDEVSFLQIPSTTELLHGIRPGQRTGTFCHRYAGAVNHRSFATNRRPDTRYLLISACPNPGRGYLLENIQGDRITRRRPRDREASARKRGRGISCAKKLTSNIWKSACTWPSS